MCDSAFLISRRGLSVNAALEVRSATDGSLRTPPGTAFVHQAPTCLGPGGLPSSRLRPSGLRAPFAFTRKVMCRTL